MKCDSCGKEAEYRSKIFFYCKECMQIFGYFKRGESKYYKKKEDNE